MIYILLEFEIDMVKSVEAGIVVRQYQGSSHYLTEGSIPSLPTLVPRELPL